MEAPNSLSSNPENNNTFDNNFQVQQQEIFGKKVRTVDVSPESIKEDTLPVLFAPGWGAKPESYKGSLRMLFQNGRRAMSIEHMRYGGETHGAYDSYKDQVKKSLMDQDIQENVVEEKLQKLEENWNFLSEYFPPATLRRALSLLSILEIKNIKKADMIGHSEGGIDASVAKFLNPERVGNLVLVATGGLLGSDTTWDLVKRNAKQAQEEGKGYYPVDHRNYEFTGEEQSSKEEIEKAIRDGLTALAENPQRAVDIARMGEDKDTAWRAFRTISKYMIQNPKRAFEETQAIAISEIGPLLRLIRKDGSKVGIIHGVDDRTMPMDRMQKSGEVVADKKDEDGTMIKGSVDGFVSVLGSHNTLAAEPRIMHWADKMFTEFTKKQEDERATLAA